MTWPREAWWCRGLGSRRPLSWLPTSLLCASWLVAADPSDTRLARLEAAVRAGETTPAVELANAGLPDSPEARFWRAQAHLLAGHSSEADSLLAGLALPRDGAMARDALLTRGAIWVREENWTRALEVLAPGLDSEDVAFTATVRLRMAEIHLALGQPAETESLLAVAPESLERSLLLARAALAQNRPGDALRLASPANTKAPTGPLRATARLVLARVKAETGETVEAVGSLVDVWLRAEPDSPYATEILQTLEEIGGLDADEVTRLLSEWSSAGAPALAAAAQFAMGAALARQSHFAEAQAAFMRFGTMHADHPLAAEARVRTAEMALAQGDTAAPRNLAATLGNEIEGGAAWRTRVLFIAGQAASIAGDFVESARFFSEAAERATDPGIVRAARMNAAFGLAAANASDLASTLAPLKPWPEARATVLVDYGLYAAAQASPQASSILEQFLAESPDHPRTVEALTVLAEIDLAEEPPALAAARQHLRAARRFSTDSTSDERLDWLELWIEQSEGRIATALEKSRAFLIDRPASRWRPVVHLKRAEWLGRGGDWAAATAEYKTLAEAAEDRPALSARSLYLAGLAELNIPSPDSLDRAIDHWRDAAAQDESMVFPARFQQAIAKGRLGKNDEALRQLEALLTGKPPLLPAQRQAALYARGELFLRPGPGGAGRPEEALAAFSEVAEDPASSPPLRAQALCRQADALRLLGRTREALAAYTAAADPLLKGNPASSLAGTIWPARAGLSAVALLDERKEWKAAADLAQRLADAPGPHSISARQQASRLRLEHFIWEP